MNPKSSKDNNNGTLLLTAQIHAGDERSGISDRRGVSDHVRLLFPMVERQTEEKLLAALNSH